MISAEKSMQRTFPLTGPSGEPIDLWRVIYSQGMSSLPPMAVDEEERSLTITLPQAGIRPRTLWIGPGPNCRGLVRIGGRKLSDRRVDAFMKAVRQILQLDLDLSEFYRMAAPDPDLAWTTSGAGRLIRSGTVFEDVIKTICTTNCAWSLTVKLVSGLCQHLGQKAEGAPADGPQDRTFPTPEAMASKDEAFYRNIIRAGYRSPYLVAIARGVAEGRLALEPLGRASREELPDDELEKALLDLPGVGPYAAAHIMLTLGRYSRLVLDSWTRPTYAKMCGADHLDDDEIKARFKRYGRFAGLAFWMFLTRPWVDDA